jgi:hypothetical protein
MKMAILWIGLAPGPWSLPNWRFVFATEYDRDAVRHPNLLRI